MRLVVAVFVAIDAIAPLMLVIPAVMITVIKPFAGFVGAGSRQYDESHEREEGPRDQLGTGHDLPPDGNFLDYSPLCLTAHRRCSQIRVGWG
jgi:hypothetical protein